MIVTGGSSAVAAERRAEPLDVRLSLSQSGPAAAPIVRLRALLLKAGRPAQGRVAVVQVRDVGATRWRDLRIMSTDHAGRTPQLVIRPKRSKQLRVQARADGRSFFGPVRVARVEMSLSARVLTSRTPIAGEAIALSGHASPALIGARARLQMLTAEGWRSVVSSFIEQNGNYALHAVATLGGDRRYRVLVEPGVGYGTVTSPEQELTVYGWYRLTGPRSEPADGATSSLVQGRDVIGGSPYGDALGAVLDEGQRASASFDLDHRCVSIRGVYGPTAGSRSDFLGSFLARADDDVLVRENIPRGDVRAFQADVSGAGQVAFLSAALISRGSAAWGDLEVLCAGAPN